MIVGDDLRPIRKRSSAEHRGVHALPGLRLPWVTSGGQVFRQSPEQLDLSASSLVNM